MKLPDAHRLLNLDSVDSTNLEARRLAEAGERGPLWICAGEQTAGRGRLGRAWQSPPGNLYATFLGTVGCRLAEASQLGFVAALSVHDAITALRPRTSLKLKWPNDVLLEDGKISGLLAEVLMPSPLVIAMGFGINLASAPSGLSYPAASLGGGIDPGIMLNHLAQAFELRIRLWDEGRGFSAIRQDWCKRSYPLGTLLTVDGRQGAFAGLGVDGALLLEDANHAISPIHAGDVRIAAPALT